MTDRARLDWTGVFNVRTDMQRVAHATGLDEQHVNKFIGQEVARLKAINPNAADELCAGALDEIENESTRRAWREMAWMWLGGQSLIDQASERS